MNIALSGSNGFIGNELKHYLKNLKDVNLILISRKKNEKSNFKNEYSFDDYFQKRINEKIDIFLHLASPNFDNEKDNILENGIVKLTENVFNFLPNYNCSNFIFFSSCKVYGEPSFNNSIFNETSKPSPQSDYAKAKLKTENMIIKNSEINGVNFLIYRLPFVYGLGMKSNLSKILSLIDRSLPFFMPVNPNLKKSFLYKGTINKVIEHNISNPYSINNEILNLADNSPITLGEFINKYKELNKSKSTIYLIPNYIFNFFKRLPLIRKLFAKVYGSFEIDNKKIKMINKVDIISTYNGIVNFSEKKNT